jgi:hypothetical protein
MRKTGRGFLAAVLVALAAFSVAPIAGDSLGSFLMPFDDDVIRYRSPEARDPVARLQPRIDQGEVKLSFNPRHGYLDAVLRALNVPVSSQVLVFSKTSFQAAHISPQAPRALYFNDDVYVGWVQGGDVVEVASVDPEKGGIFYTLAQQNASRPKFARRDDCLQCHAAPPTLGVPGFFLRSVYPGPDGTPLLQAGSFDTTDHSPMNERWGGWYVSGVHGKQLHMGNVVAKDPANPEQLDRVAGADVTDLRKLLDVTPYLTPHSDIVALMVLEHQVRLHDLITRVNYETRIVESEQQVLARQYGETFGVWSESARRRVNRPVEVLLQDMLFTGEALLTDPVKGTSNFQAEFEQRGPKDHLGRSLRQFDLRRRLFRYPCSFLIYSEAFDSLPKVAKDRLYRRLWEVLTGRDGSPAFAALSSADRQAIFEILLETKPGLPDYWKQAPAAPGSGS